MIEAGPWSYHVEGSPGSLVRTDPGKLQKQGIRASLSSVAVQ